MPSTHALEQAAQCWCDPRVADRPFDPALAEVFAELLDRPDRADPHFTRHGLGAALRTVAAALDELALSPDGIQRDLARPAAGPSLWLTALSQCWFQARGALSPDGLEIDGVQWHRSLVKLASMAIGAIEDWTRTPAPTPALQPGDTVPPQAA